MFIVRPLCLALLALSTLNPHIFHSATTPSRSTDVFFKNLTDRTLTRAAIGLEHGIWTLEPPLNIAPGATGHFMSESSGFMTGTEGGVVYQVEGAGRIGLHWDNPFYDDPYDSNNKYGEMPTAGFAIEHTCAPGANATVTYWIHTDGARGPGATEDLDLVSDTFDPNGLLLNPKWGWQTRNVGFNPDPTQLCPEFGRSPCHVSQPVMLERIFPGSGAPFSCLGDNNRPGGHLNWFPVTYYGPIRWLEHDNGLGHDDDYNFALTPPGGVLDDHNRGGAGLVSDNEDGSIKCEFQEAETVDHFRSVPWWNRFRQAVHSSAETAARDLVDGKDAIVIGLLGFDTVHCTKTELHPVFAMAVHATDAEADDVWPFFMRNWGNEGYCSSHIWFLGVPENRVVIRIPWRAHATSVRIVEQSISTNGNIGGPFYTIVPAQGIDVAFVLPSPEEAYQAEARVSGELHLQWTMLAASRRRHPTPTHRSIPHSTSPERGEGDDFQRLVAQMTDAQRRIFYSNLPQENKESSRIDALLDKTRGQVTSLKSFPAPTPQSNTYRALQPIQDRKRMEYERRRFEALRAAFGGKIPQLKNPSARPENRPLKQAPVKPQKRR